MFAIRYVVLLILLLGVLFLWQTLQRTPSHDKNWYDFYTKTPDAAFAADDSIITLSNVRNWNHATSGTLSRDWIDTVAINPKEVVSVWFALSRFGSAEKVTGHSFLSFELASGEVYSLSIEARREVGEDYSAFSGLFNQYELWYGWGTERDFLGTRLFDSDDPLEYYRLDLTPDEVQAVFRAVALETQSVAKTPQFYNTLTANCTNLLAKAINRSYPDRIPYHLAWNLPGLSVTFLQQEALIDERISVKTHRQAATISPHDPDLKNSIYESEYMFSQRVRSQLLQE